MSFDDKVPKGIGEDELAGIDLPFAFLANETQGLARLASSRMDLPAETATARYRRRATLMALLANIDPLAGTEGQSLPMGPRTWSPERIAEVVARARAMLMCD